MGHAPNQLRAALANSRRTRNVLASSTAGAGGSKRLQCYAIGCAHLKLSVFHPSWQVGFDTTMMEGMVNELSGGWRMKLAIACAMLQVGNLEVS